MRTKNRKTRSLSRLFPAICLSAGLLAACGANESILKSGKETPARVSVESKKSSFDQDLESMRTANFSFIYVLRRKDGQMIDAEDRGVIKIQTVEMNRRVSADDGKAFIIGSNYVIPAEKLATLRDRFAVEDLSPGPQPPSNANTEANK